MEKADFYCELYKAIYERVSKVCPEDARDVSIKILEEIAKDIRTERMKAKAKADVGYVTGEELATKKQREALHKFGVKIIPENLSKREASEILDKLVSFSKDGDSESIAKLVEGLNAKWKRFQ